MHGYNQKMALSLSLAKWNLWGLGAESWFVAVSYAFAKMILQWGHHFGKNIP
jgi:hypothetical protein